MVKAQSNRTGGFSSNTATAARSFISPHVIITVVLLNLLCFQLIGLITEQGTSAESTAGSIILSSSGGTNINNLDPLKPNPGKAKALPSIRVQNDQTKRNIYGGKGDGKHLGGWTDIDIHGISVYLWRHMIETLGIHSLLDVGCGRGISTSWFLMNGVDALCVEGSHDAYENSVLPDKETQMVEHDFSRGPWWPEKTYDAVWCVEFLEHVGRQFHKNYLPVFRKAAIIFVTHSNWGGWHHVEVHSDEWWINKFELYGFKYMLDLTKELREVARQEALVPEKAVNGENANPQNLYSMLIFFNPAVGALPQHAHLFAEHGCFDARPEGKTKTRECTEEGNEEKMPPEFYPLPLLDENQKKWEEHIRSKILNNNNNNNNNNMI